MIRNRFIVAAGISALALGGCRTSIHNASSQIPQQTPPPVSAAPQAAGGSCHARPGPLPDPACTPGVTNPNVTQANISSTICRSGWTKTIRPPSSVTDQLKRQQISAYGYTDTSSHSYEEDHLISLELGGSPDDPKNLWPEPGASPNAKDKVENDLNHAICSGRAKLADAQHDIATDWTTAERLLGIGG
jgi:hypothetical protein